MLKAGRIGEEQEQVVRKSQELAAHRFSGLQLKKAQRAKTVKTQMTDNLRAELSHKP